MKQKYIYKFIAPLVSLLLTGTSCTDFLTENNENGKYDANIAWSTPQNAEGVLLQVYKNLPTDYTAKDDWATDDMVTNVLTDATVSMGNGGWTSANNPLTNYNAMYANFVQLNDFLAHVESVKWTNETDNKGDTLNAMYVKRLKGEAYGLRAWCGAQLLKTVGGKDINGTLLGYPIVTSVIENADAGKLPRNTYAECVAQIFSDCDNAFNNLPLTFVDGTLNGTQKRVLGSAYANRINGKTIKLLKSSVALRAASPAFAESGVTWTQAAQFAADVMNLNGGLTKLNVKDVQFYLQVDATYLGAYTESFWYTTIGTAAQSLDRESNNFPPSLFGKGQINPSQNLVDCFPDKNGYPITFAAPPATYNPATPYANRDPRLKLYIYYDGATTSGSPIATIRTARNLTVDSKDSITTSTRTSYYLRKLMDEKVKLNVGAQSKTTHIYVYARYTEALLNFAEAANEAVGPDVAIGGFTARQVINAIRARAGIASTAYTALLTTKEDFRTLIHNERRIELCFEGSRFWDLRRWKDLNSMKQTVKGAVLSKDLSSIVKVDIEPRVFSDYMIYAPLPYDETLKYNLVQNQGW
jgi:hypothetical protein